jgi:probable selenium-dependent hydroxylase accessory protein YqeC
LFSRQFDFRLPTIVNFVGGGGKTSLILRLLHELSSLGPVLYTTTTRIHPPHPDHGISVISCDDQALLKVLVEQAAQACTPGFCKLVATRLSVGPGVLGGVSPSFAKELHRHALTAILNEADGARSMSLKMPREGEPVLMEGAAYLVPVIGADCLNQPLGPATLFRWDMAAARYGLRQGETITPEVAASLLLHPQGVCRDWRPGIQLIPFINKVDTEAAQDTALQLAYALMNGRTFPVSRVVLGSVEKLRAVSITAHRQ